MFLGTHAGRAFCLSLALLATGSAWSQEASRPSHPELEIRTAAGVSETEYLWVSRQIIVFADTPRDPRFTEQIALLEAGQEDLAARDVVVITDTDPAAASALRLALRPRGFMMVLIGKDGEIRLRKPFPWDAREISRSIDKIPLRQQELEERRSGENASEIN